MRLLRSTPALAVVIAAPALSLVTAVGLPSRAALAPPSDPQDPALRAAITLRPSPWQLAPSDAPAQAWEQVNSESSLPPEFSPIPARRNPADLSVEPRIPTRRFDENVGIYGIGGGVRWGGSSGENNNNGVLTGRVGYKLNNDLAISVRPSYIFQGTNSQGFSNGAFQMPLTLDLFRQSVVSPYIGGGIATNTDSSGYTDPMLSGGLDIKLHENLILGLNVNYIFQNKLNDTDWEAMTLLYLRF